VDRVALDQTVDDLDPAASRYAVHGVAFPSKMYILIYTPRRLSMEIYTKWIFEKRRTVCVRRSTTMISPKRSGFRCRPSGKLGWAPQ
jgi:hypothetical protein